MRQLKFRVWDTLAKHYIYPEDPLAAAHYTISLDGKVYNLQNGSGSPELVIQQWTGLTDKNGKDIYDGDLVLVSGEGWGRQPAIDCVSFYNGTYILPDLDVSCSDLELEVVGNSCENPEFYEMINSSVESFIKGLASESIDLTKYNE
jgi:hypothetical protein